MMLSIFIVGAHAESVIVVEDDLDYYRALPIALENNYPLVHSEQTDNGPLEHFIELYNGNSVTLNDAIAKKNYKTKETIIISSSTDKRITAMAAQISYELNATFVLDVDLKEYLNELKLLTLAMPELEVIAFGEVNTNIPFVKKVQKFILFEQVYSYYEKIFSHTDLTVFVEDDDMISLGVYLAGHRGGRMIFELDSNMIKTKQYLAWLVMPTNFSPDKLRYIYELLDENSDGINDRGMGVITGKNLQQANLPLVRSFFYEDISKSNHLLVVDSEAKDNEKRFNDSQWTYTLLGGKKTNKKMIIDEIQNAKYVKIIAHGSPESLLLGDGNYLNANNIPLLNSTLFIAESCETGYISARNSIALDIIEKGAVAYVGSYKNGGVTNPIFGGNFSHLLSDDSTALSDIVAFHNQGIMHYIEEIPRAFLIGDPKWGMFKESRKWIGKDYEYNQIPTFGEEFILTVELNTELNTIGTIIRNPHDVNQILDKPRTRVKNDYGRQSIFILTKIPSGIIEFIDYIPMRVKLTEIRLFFTSGLRFLQGELFVSSLILSILVLFAGMTLYYLQYSSRISDKNIIVPMVITITFVIIMDYFMLDLVMNFWKYIWYSICFYIGFKQKNILKGILALNLLFLIPVLFILKYLQSNFKLYLLTISGLLIMEVLFVTAWFISKIRLMKSK